ncbi:GGDEF domain-containing response regulator [Pseudoalteromonas pernae]|uniref:GGDEF domain-containing response regulator n=1 Tax=Pseudoalteromonas pernae TaxID=3118054 RepID=UPI003242D2B7
MAFPAVEKIEAPLPDEQQVPPLIYIVDDEEISLEILKELLKPLGEVVGFADGASCVEACENKLPDIIIMDVNLGAVSGLQICRKLKSMSSTKDVPIIFITASQNTHAESECWQAGGADFVNKPVNAMTLQHRVRSQLRYKQQADQLRQLTYVDELCGIYNKRYLIDSLTRDVRAAKRSHSAISLLMVDIDWFKPFNDFYGHLHGDTCLKEVAQTLKSCLLRPNDYIARYGGEEFTCVLNGTNEEEAITVATRMMEAIAHANIKHEKSEFGHVTISIGIFCAQRIENLQDKTILQHADNNLYEAKRRGRSQIVSSCDGDLLVV